MTQFTFGDLWRLIYDILETTDDDYCALYETYWSLPMGDVEEPILGGRKKYRLASLMSINMLLYKKDYVDNYSSIEAGSMKSAATSMRFPYQKTISRFRVSITEAYF